MQINKTSKSELKRFIRLERALLGNYENYVSPLDEDLMNRFTGKTYIYEQVEFALFIAKSGNKDVGRCAAIINRKYQRDKKEQVGSIGYFAALPNQKEEMDGLIKEAEAWLVDKNITRIIAPWDGTTGTDSLYVPHEELPIFPCPWHPNYYHQYFQKNGYQVKVKRSDYEISFTSKLYQAAKKKYLNPIDYQVRPFSKRSWDEDLEIMRKLFNATFRKEWECFKYTTEEFNEMFEALKPIVDYNHFLIAEDNSIPIGFCFGMTDLSPLFRSLKGKLGIFQLPKAVIQARKFKRAGLLNIGVLPAYRRKGVATSLALRLYDSYEKHGLTKASYYLVNDYNKGARKLAKSLGGQAHIVGYCLDKRMK